MVNKIGISSKNEEKSHSNQSCFFTIGVRHTQVLLLFLLLTSAYGTRICLSIGIVAMTNVNSTFTPTYDWNDKSTILSSFFWGNIVTLLPAGYIATNYGPKIPFCITTIICSIFTIAIPFMAELGSYGVMICRIIQGATQGFFMPGVSNLLGKWVPPSERSRMGSFVYSGCILGTAVSMPITGWFCESPYGWPSAFYFFGCMSIIWVVAWFFLGSNSPTEHKSISIEELEYIEKSFFRSEKPKAIETPWKSFLTSIPLWSLLIAHMAQNWGFWIMVTEIPSYISAIFDLDVSSDGLLSSVPYFFMWISTFAYSSLADFLINRGTFTIGTVRKFLNSIGFYGPAMALIFLSFYGDVSLIVTMVLLVLTVGLNAAMMSGFSVNHVDLSPTHSGTLMGATAVFASAMAILGPLCVQWIVTDETDTYQWMIIFLTSAAIQIVGNTLFVIYGSGEIQPWDPSYGDARKNRNSTDARKQDNEKI